MFGISISMNLLVKLITYKEEKLELYKGKYWDVIFGDWCQEFPGYCILSSEAKSLSDLSSEAWIELGILEKELERLCK